MSQLINSSKLVSCVTVAAGAAGTSAIEGSVIDFSGFTGALIQVMTGPIVANAVTSIKFQHGAAADLSDAVDVVGTSQTIADDDDNKVFYIDVSRVTKRYGRLYVSRATQNATVAAVALLYGGSLSPVTQGTGVSGETHVAKIAGTA